MHIKTVMYGTPILYRNVEKANADEVWARAREGNWQPQRNCNFREISPISSRQLVSNSAGAH
jgi:hypothetical protein